MTIPIANLYYLLCYAWKHVREADIVRLEELAGLTGPIIFSARSSPKGRSA